MQYLTNGTFNETELAIFTASDGYSSSHMKPMAAWRDASGVVRCGTWLGEWGKIEKAWALNTWGKWQGAPPALVIANELQVKGITATREGDDLVWHVESGAAFSLDWYRRTPDNWATNTPGVRNGANAHVSIYKCSDGTIISTASSPTVPLLQAALDDGSYVVYVQYLGIQEGLRLPPSYARDPQYDYVTSDGRLSHFNPVLFVGEIPADADHALNVLRRQLIASNSNQDDWHYSAYITSEAAVNGEGSAIKLQVGEGDWAIGDGVFVTPSRALCKLDFDNPEIVPEGTSPASLVPLRIDPMAHVISYVLHTRKDGIWGGKVLLGGARFSGNAARPALWQWNDDGSTTLLGVTEQACDAICEQMMTTGLVTGLQELQDGSIVMLTLCSRHLYDSTGIVVEDRLPRWTAATDGEPGGRSMCAVGDGIGTRVVHTTEAFGREPDPKTPSFYNVGVDIQGDDLRYFPGTLCHLDGVLWRHRGRVYGVRCDGDPTSTDSREQVTYYDGIWNKSAPPWNPAWLVLQRGASINGMNLTFGWVPGSETAQVLRDDSVVTKVLLSSYRVRAGTVTNNANSVNLQSLIMPAQKVVAAEGSNPQHLQSGWVLIETDGGVNGQPPYTENPPTEASSDDERRHRVLELTAHSPIHAVQIRDMMSGKYFSSANADSEESEVGVWLRIDSTADIDDWSTYIWRPSLDRPFVLPIPALSKVEMLIISKPDFAPEQLPQWGACA